MNNEISSVKSSLVEGIRENAGLAMGTGVFLLIIGVISVAAPAAAGVSLTFVVGILLVLGGIVQCVFAFKAGIFGRGLLIALLGALTFLSGIYMMRQPVAALASITFFLALYFMASGIVEIVTAFGMKPANGWGWMLFNAIVTLVLGVMLWRQFPLSGIWAVGVLFGFKLICSGGTLISLGSAVRNDVP